MRIYHLVLMLLLQAVQSAYAADNDSPCSQAVYDVLSRFYQKPLFAQPDKVVASACKIWPYRPNLTLAAVAFDEAVEQKKTLVVATLELEKSLLVYSKKEVIDENPGVSFGSNSLTIDTARWQLSDTVRAFGVRFNSSGLLPCGPRFRDELSLYVPEKQNLRLIFSMPMYVEEVHGGCPPGANSTDFVKVGYRTVSIAKSKNNGFFDLNVTETITTESNPELDNQSQTRRSVLKFDGKSYSPPVLDGIFLK